MTSHFFIASKLCMFGADKRNPGYRKNIYFTYYYFRGHPLPLHSAFVQFATKTEDVNRTSFSNFSHFCIFIVREISIREILCFAKENILISQ